VLAQPPIKRTGYHHHHHQYHSFVLLTICRCADAALSVSLCTAPQGEHISGGVLRTFDRTKSPVVGERDHPSLRWMDNKSKKGMRMEVFHLVSRDPH